MRNVITAMMVTSLTMIGCSKSSDNGSAGPKPSSNQDQSQQRPQKGDNPPPNPSGSNGNSGTGSGAGSNSGSSGSTMGSGQHAATPIVLPLPLPQKSEEAPPPADFKGRMNTAFANTRSYLEDKWDNFNDLVKPNEDRITRNETLDHSRDQEEFVRDRKLEILKNEIASTRPLQIAQAQSAIRPADETTTLLANLMVEPSTEKVPALTTTLVDEIFSEPEIARAKIMEVQLSLRHLAEGNLYGSDQSKRVAFLQSNLDSRIKSDQNTELLRDGLIIAGSSAMLGAVSGFHGFDRVKAFVDDYRGPSVVSPAELTSKTKGVLLRARENIGAAFARTGAALKSTFVPLKAEQIAARNLKSLGLNDVEVEGLELAPIARLNAFYYDFRPTNIEGFSYAVSDKVQGSTLTDERVILISLPRRRIGGSRLLISRKLPTADIEGLEQKIKYLSPEEGGRQFATIVDSESGETISTRIPAEDLSSDISGIESQPGSSESIESTSPTTGSSRRATTARATSAARRSRRSVPEAQASGDAPLDYGQEGVSGNASSVTPPEPTLTSGGPSSTGEAAEPPIGEVQTGKRGFAQRTRESVTGAMGAVASGAQNAATSVASGARRAVHDAADGTRSAWRNFDGRWATAVAAGTALPLYGLYYEGYGMGRDHGQNYETVYLESLIPRESLNQVAVVLEQSNGK